MIIFAHIAGVIRDGLARVHLQVHEPTPGSRHLLTAAAYRVAASLETIAAEGNVTISVSASKAALGIVEFTFGSDMCRDVAEEIAIDVCGGNGFWPADVLVEMGEIIMPGQFEECENNACAGCAWCNAEVGQ